MILSYDDRIMADTPSNLSLVRSYRLQHGWSQDQLARRAGISRTGISAIENHRLVPSVTAALALAQVFGCTVESLFPPAPAPTQEPEWAWPPERTPCRYWQAVAGGRVRLYPAENTAAGVLAHDGVFQEDTFLPSTDRDPPRTLVIAGCDPAAGLLAGEYARACGFRLLALHRTSHEALALLGQGLVDAAGVHFATEQDPDANARAVEAALGTGYRLLRIASWEEGLSVAPANPVTTVGAALRGRLRWVGREAGSAARQCLDELLPERRPPRRIARDHRGVAEAVRCGWADVGVCHRLVAEEAGLRFFGIRQEQFELCYADAAAGDPRLQALVSVVRSASYRNVLGELPGYGTRHSGEVRRVGQVPERRIEVPL
jgi:molybdate-binding protein/DNA-binding XRE family transcriptional regulator